MKRADKSRISMRGLSRIDCKHTHGWLVRRYKNGRTYGKLFSDLKCGGKLKAREAAKKFRDDLESQLDKIDVKKTKLQSGSYVAARNILRDVRDTNGIDATE